MRKTFSTLTLAIIGYCSYAQTNIFPASGKVGIGTTSPGSALTVQGILANDVLLLKQVNGNAMLSINTTNGSPFQDIYQTNGTIIGIHLNSNGNTYFNNGNVGIGTTTPTEKLSVKGEIRAQEIKVEMSNWPDYVFAKNYKLPSLQQTEKHIKEKGYLPGMPSAADVKANGVNLGDINAKLLQKIEELTLIMIQLNKKVEQQSATLKLQQKQINKLK